LKTALIEGKSITSNIAGRRHRQFIGVLMRDVDPESIRLALLHAEDYLLVETRAEQEAKAWTDELLTGIPAKMEALLVKFQGLDRQRMKQLVRNIKNGKSENKSKKHRDTLEKLIIAEINSK